MKQYSLAREVIEAAVKTLKLTDGEALLAEALTTSAIVAVRMEWYSEAKKNFEAAHRIAERCGDREGAGRALLVMFEEMGSRLEKTEETQLLKELKALFAGSQQTSLHARLESAIERSRLDKGEIRQTNDECH
jgi:hypothetical protein